MKKRSIKILYRLFSSLSDKTNGFTPFVTYKLALGALLIGIGAGSSSCKKTQSSGTNQNNHLHEIEKSDTMGLVTLKKSIKNKDTLHKNAEDTVLPTAEEILRAPALCYFIAPVIIERKETGQSKDSVFVVAEEQPNFPGGTTALFEFIQNNLKYPDTSKNTSGKVIVQFIVRSDGKINNIRVTYSSSNEFDEEAVLLIQSMPRWIPGKQNGNPVDVYFTLPIRFKK